MSKNHPTLVTQIDATEKKTYIGGDNIYNLFECGCFDENGNESFPTISSKYSQKCEK